MEVAAGPLTDARAAALVGVSRDQVVATRDGFLEVQMIDPSNEVQVLLISDSNLL
jgi:hypothetical protein